MRLLLSTFAAALLLGCAAPPTDAGAACRAQGHEPGSDAWRACIDAGGAAIATGPGSPYAYRDID